MPAKVPNKLFHNSNQALAAHKMAMEGEDAIYEARFWKNFHEEFPDLSPGAVQSVIENNWAELDNKPADQAIDHLVRLAGGSRGRPPPRSEERREAEGWGKLHRNPDAPLTTADIVRGRAANRRQWQEASRDRIFEKRRADAPLDDARKELARLKKQNAASSSEDAA